MENLGDLPAELAAYQAAEKCNAAVKDNDGHQAASHPIDKQMEVPREL